MDRMKFSIPKINVILTNELVKFGGNYNYSSIGDLRELYEQGITAKEIDRESYVKEVGNDKALEIARTFQLKGGVGTKPLYLTVLKNDIQSAYKFKQEHGEFSDRDYIILKLIGEIE